MSYEKTKFRVGKLLVPVTLEYVKVKNLDYINLHFPYNPKLLKIVKESFEGREWMGPPKNPGGPKLWRIPITQRNNWWLQYLRHDMPCPYAKYDATLDPDIFNETVERVKEYALARTPRPDEYYQHQYELVAHALITRTCMWAAEMGLGKTLSAFIFMEMIQEELGIETWWWVAPNSALYAFEQDRRKWLPRINVRTMTYEGFKSKIIDGQLCPRAVVFDESPRIKTFNAKRSIAARNTTNDMRDLYPDSHVILCMSGSPSPKSPLDWWHQIEVLEPGYLSEKDIYIFREKLGVFEEAADGAYKTLKSWYNDENKCEMCCELEDHANHKMSPETVDKYHPFKRSTNRVTELHERLKGISIFRLKKDCLDLPPKIYNEIVLKPSPETIQAAQLIARTSTRVIDALTKLRMLSDGFQYIEEKTGDKPCPLCHGSGQHMIFIDPDKPDDYAPDHWVAQGQRPVYDEHGEIIRFEACRYVKELRDCPNCGGSGTVNTYVRSSTRVACPKDDALAQDLDTHEESGRLCVYAGFTDSVNRIVSNCHQLGWTTIRADGRGWEGQTPEGDILERSELLTIFQEKQIDYPRVCFVGQPGSAGEGLTLTASHTITFWSNDFNGGYRMQAEDRGHRLSMDKERGGRITDYIHLASDLYVLKNLKEKKDLQMQTMTGLRSFLNVQDKGD